MAPLLAGLVAEASAQATRPFEGISVPTTLARTSPTADTAPIIEAGLAFVESLHEDQRIRVSFPLDASERRTWFNVHPNVTRHGLLLEDLTPTQRARAMSIIEATLSARGYAQARNVMRINGFLVGLTGRPEEFGEWPYFFSIFGTPHPDEPWAWQIDGHHLNLNVLVCGDQLSMTPSFMGSEPCQADGMTVFDRETEVGLAFVRSLDEHQFAKARRYPSILRADLPAELSGMLEGRTVAGAFRDNVPIEHTGIRGDELTDVQRHLLVSVAAAFVGWAGDRHAGVRLDEVIRHLDETSLTWMGPTSEDGPCYYRLLSPVVLIEFDHHPGIIFDNVEPSRHHVHTVVRTPNKGDYGTDILAEHYKRFDHR